MLNKLARTTDEDIPYPSEMSFNVNPRIKSYIHAPSPLLVEAPLERKAGLLSASLPDFPMVGKNRLNRVFTHRFHTGLGKCQEKRCHVGITWACICIEAW